jgi:hypothetical protein
MKRETARPAMSINRSDPTRYFSVVGPAYVAERHADSDDSGAVHAVGTETEPSLTVSWIVLIALIAGISVFAGEISVLSSIGLTTDLMAAVVQ